MPGYLVDEGGERTHAVLPLDEYERLKKAEERLENVRGYAMEMVAAMGREEQADARGGTDSESEGAGEEQRDRAWSQRT